MCFDLDRFIDQEQAAELVCPICQNVLCCPQINKNLPLSKQEAVNGNEGGHKYCEKCIIEWLKFGNVCPNCNKPLKTNDLQQLDWFASNALKRLKLHCKYYKEGCEFIDRLELIEQHELNTCQFRQNHTSLSTTQEGCRPNDVIKEPTIQLNNYENELKDIKLKNEMENLKINEVITRPYNYPPLINLISLCNNKGIKNYNSIKLFIQNGANVNYVNNDNETALIAASRNGYFDIVKLLVKNGANKNIKNKYGNTAIMFACYNGYNDIAKFLIDEISINDKNDHGKTCLNIVTEEHNFELFKLLIKNGADINCQDKDNHTPLIVASSNGHFDMVELLINNGANVNMKTKYGSSSLNIASWKGYEKIVKFLIENKANVNDKNDRGNSSLLSVAETNNIGIFKLLLKSGADVNCQNNESETPIILASKNGNLDMIKLLINNGAKVNVKNKYGTTPLIIASSLGHEKIVKFLLENGANINDTNNSGHNALDLAKTKNITDYLVKKLFRK